MGRAGVNVEQEFLLWHGWHSLCINAFFPYPNWLTLIGRHSRRDKYRRDASEMRVRFFLAYPFYSLVACRFLSNRQVHESCHRLQST